MGASQGQERAQRLIPRSWVTTSSGCGLCGSGGMEARFSVVMSGQETAVPAAIVLAAWRVGEPRTAVGAVGGRLNREERIGDTATRRSLRAVRRLCGPVPLWDGWGRGASCRCARSCVGDSTRLGCCPVVRDFEAHGRRGRGQACLFCCAATLACAAGLGLSEHCQLKGRS